MTEQADLTILSGGFYHCTPSWDKPANELDQCYKFYLPIRGEAYYIIDGQPRVFCPGAFYLFSGFHVQRQYCPDFCDVYWLHFVPDAWHISIALTQAPPVMKWPVQPYALWKPCLQHAVQIFDYPKRERNSLKISNLDPRMYQIRSMLLFFISDFMLRRKSSLANFQLSPIDQALGPAITFMDQDYLNNPSLAEIAGRVHLCPNYFQRKFVAAFQITPHEYMARRRMNRAKELLANTSLSIKEIAMQLGYHSPFYFSRAFSRRFGCGPRCYRKRIRHI